MECSSHWPERHSLRWHWLSDWLVTPDPPQPPAHPRTRVAWRPAFATSLRATARAPSLPASGSRGDPARALAPPPGRAALQILLRREPGDAVELGGAAGSRYSEVGVTS